MPIEGSVMIHPGIEFKILTKKETKGKKDFAFQIVSPQKRFKEINISCESNEEVQSWINTIKQSLALGTNELFGLDLMIVIKKDQLQGNISENGLMVPHIVTKSIQHLQHFIETEGLFRLSGSLDEVNALKNSFNSGNPSDFSTTANPHVVSNLLKLFFRELPDPLLTYERYDAFVKLSKESSDTQVSNLKNLIEGLPKPNKDTFVYLMKFLNTVSEKSATNKMTALNLATVFGPTILRPREETLTTAGNNDLVNSLTEVMIVNVPAQFPSAPTTPPQVAISPSKPRVNPILSPPIVRKSMMVPPTSASQQNPTQGLEDRGKPRTASRTVSFDSGRVDTPNTLVSPRLPYKANSTDKIITPAPVRAPPPVPLQRSTGESSASPPIPIKGSLPPPGTLRAPLPQDATSDVLPPSPIAKFPSSDSLASKGKLVVNAQPPPGSPKIVIRSARNQPKISTMTKEEKIQALHEAQQKNLDLAKRIQKHL